MIYYITSVKMPAVNAQSVQIMSNAVAFSECIGTNFQLVSPENDENIKDPSHWWRRIRCMFSSGRSKYLEFAWRCSRMTLPKGAVVYTRDILIAYIFSKKECRIVYEAHQKPSGKACSLINSLKGSGFKVVCISQALKHYYVGHFGIHEKNILVAHDGVFVERYLKSSSVDIRHEFKIPSSLKIFLHTGSLYRGRGAELFSGLLERFPNIAIVHVGGNQSQLDYWSKEIGNERFYSKAHVSNEELISYQVSTEYLLYPMTRTTPTYWCCSPMKIFEYMAARKPIVASSIGSIKEVLNSQNSFCFDPEQAETLYDAVNSCIKNHDLANELADRAYSDVLTHYAWQKRIADILKFIDS